MYYQEITILPSVDTSSGFLWSKVFSKLHQGFVPMEDGTGNKLIRVSFPDYDAKRKESGLGNKLRIFADDKKTLEHLEVKKDLEFLSDYVHITSIKEVPCNVRSYSCFKRYQAKCIRSNRNIALAFAKRNGTSYEEELSRISTRQQGKTDLPYIVIQSSSTGCKFKLFITRTEVARHSDGIVTSYGLSDTATVPNF
jgi:CRISPR-associated endonuclease Csy4